MDSLFDPKDKRYQAIGDALQKGEHAGPDGSVMLAVKMIYPLARKGDIAAMMFLANCLYTWMGVAASKGLLGKVCAVYCLYASKRWATKTFKKATEESDLIIAIKKAEEAMVYKHLKLGIGDFQILQTAHIQWAAQVKRRLKLGADKEVAVANACLQVIMKDGRKSIGLLAEAAMLSLPGLDEVERERINTQLNQFVDRFYPLLKAVKPDDMGIVQTFCRVARALGAYRLAIEIGERYGLYDQVMKAKAGT